MSDAIHDYLSKIGRHGGQKSRRTLTKEQALAMVEAMLVKSGDDVYAIPMDAVRETVKAPRAGASGLTSGPK